MRKQMTICGEHFDIEPAEGGGYRAVLRRNEMFFFTGANHADLRRRMPAEMEAWQAEQLKAREADKALAVNRIAVDIQPQARGIIGRVAAFKELYESYKMASGAAGLGQGENMRTVYDGMGRAWRYNPYTQAGAQRAPECDIRPNMDCTRQDAKGA